MTFRFSRIGICAWLLCFAVASVRPLTRTFAQAPAAKPCSQPVYRQFDFSAGDWDAFDFRNGTKEAHVRVERILGGCVLHEQYDGLDGHRGESFSIYDSSRKVWHQTWVTNRGELLVIEGNLEDGAMVLRGASQTAEGKERRVRGMWKPVPGGVRESAVTSFDGGKTWQPWFDLIFRYHPSVATIP